MCETVVDQLYAEFTEMVKYLQDQGEVSFRSTADDNFRKSLIIAAASYFEVRICADIISVLETDSIENKLLVELARNKVITRQYHTFFNWRDVRNANDFFAMFGTDFKTYMKEQVKSDDELNQAILAFIELGRDRNRLVHQDYAALPLEKTAKEIYHSYKAALVFVEAVPKGLRAYVQDSLRARQPTQSPA